MDKMVRSQSGGEGHWQVQDHLQLVGHRCDLTLGIFQHRRMSMR